MKYDTIEIGALTLRPDPSGRWAYLGSGLTLIVSYYRDWYCFDLSHKHRKHSIYGSGYSIDEALSMLCFKCIEMAEHTIIAAAVAGIK